MSVVHIYPYVPQHTEAGPMNYSHCGSHFGQCGPLSGHTEFDKAAEHMNVPLKAKKNSQEVCHFCHLGTSLFWR